MEFYVVWYIIVALITLKKYWKDSKWLILYFYWRNQVPRGSAIWSDCRGRYFQTNWTCSRPWCGRWSHSSEPGSFVKMMMATLKQGPPLTSPLSLAMALTVWMCSSVSSIPYSSHIAMYSGIEMVPSPPVSALSKSSHRAEMTSLLWRWERCEG